MFLSSSLSENGLISVVWPHSHTDMRTNSPCSAAPSTVYHYIQSNGAGQVMKNVPARLQGSQWLLPDLEDIQTYQGSASKEIFSANFHWKDNVCKNHNLQIKSVYALFLEVHPLMTTWMNLEVITLSKMSERERQM